MDDRTRERLVSQQLAISKRLISEVGASGLSSFDSRAFVQASIRALNDALVLYVEVLGGDIEPASLAKPMVLSSKSLVSTGQFKLEELNALAFDSSSWLGILNLASISLHYAPTEWSSLLVSRDLAQEARGAALESAAKSGLIASTGSAPASDEIYVVPEDALHWSMLDAHMLRSCLVSMEELIQRHREYDVEY